MAAATSRTQNLRSRLADADAKLRPVLTYVNGDTTWLLSFPRPVADQSTTGKVYYHAVIDPWFGQPAIFGSSYILEMNLGREPGLPNRTALDAAIVEIEEAAGSAITPTEAAPAVDAIFIMGIAGDHCHKPSLLQFAVNTPVFAIPAAVNTIAPWGHFNTVKKLPSCDASKASWKDAHSGSPMPSWVTAFSPSVTRMNNFGLAFITSANPEKHELVLMAPHGVGADESSIQGLVHTTEPPVKMLALVGPLKNSYTLGAQSVLGVQEALSIIHQAGNPYYVRSGDFVSLRYGGLISYTLRDEPCNLQWGIDELKKKLGPDRTIEEPRLVEVENGASFLLA